MVPEPTEVARDEPDTRTPPAVAAASLVAARYRNAEVVFLAGSVLRGEGTATSDLDLVVVFDRLDHAYRESLVWNGWPVEAFVHDPATLGYFFEEVDRPTGIVPLAHMVVEGVELPGPTALSQGLKQMARAVIEKGPGPLSEQDLRSRRYVITDLVDDARDSRSAQELVGTGVRLYEALADFYLRARGRWSAKAKAIPRRLREADPAFAERFAEAFAVLFSNHDPGPVVRLAADVLQPFGSFLFAGHRLDAPATWRRDGRADSAGPDAAKVPPAGGGDRGFVSEARARGGRVE